MSRIASTGNVTSYIDRMSTPTLGRYPEHAPVAIQSQEQILKERIRSLKIVHVPSRHHTIQNIMPATLAKEVLHLLPSTTALPAANHRARQGRPTARHQLGEE